jgi:hypothetical protein
LAMRALGAEGRLPAALVERICAGAAGRPR